MARPWLSLVVLGACAPSFDGTRTPEGGSFGSRTVELACKRIAFTADPTDVSGQATNPACKTGQVPPGAPAEVTALLGDRDSLIGALDVVVPASFTDPLQGYLSTNATLALYDDGTMGTSVSTIGDLLDDLAQDGDAMTALARTGTRIAYRPPEVATGAPAALVSSPGLGDALAKALPAINVGGVAHGEWDALVAALAATLGDASAPSDAAAADRTARLVQQLLLTERADLGEAQPVWLVRRDVRGIALPAQLAAPFVDRDGDGLADVDALGRFVDASGAVLAVAAPFPKNALYSYVDVGKTVAGALAHDAAAVFDPQKGTALDLARGASALLGPRVTATHAFDDGAMLSYRGYDTTQSPLLDMTYGYYQLLRDPNVRDLLGLADTLLASHQPAIARVLEAAVTAARTGNAHPEAQIDARAPLWDDLVPVLRQIVARPQLVKALLAALERPEVKQLAQRFGDYMKYKDRFDIDPSTQAVTGSFATMPDRTQPDNAFNRSLFERLLQVINDSNGAVVCNKDGALLREPNTGIPIATYSACDLFKVNNLAVFYMQAIAYAKDAQGRYICEDAKGAWDGTQVATTPQGCAGFGTGWRVRPKADFAYNWGGVNGLIGVFGGDGYLESDIGIAGARTHPTPEALNRILFLQPMPSALADVVDPLRDRDGDLFTSQHVGTLPVWEKNNFYDSMRPILQAFADDGSEQLFVDLLSVLHKHWPSKDSISTQHTDPTGPNYAWGSNGKSWEPLLVDVMGQDLVPALVDTAPELDAITANGKAYATIVASSASYLVAPQAGLADRQGHTTSSTSDGKPVAQLSPWQLLADAYAAKTARLALVAGEGTAWTDSVSELVDLWLRGSHGTSWSFANPRTPPMLRAVLAFVRARIDAHDLAGDRAQWLAQSLPQRTSEVLTHPVFAGVADVATAMTGNPDARVALDGLVHGALDATGQPAAFGELRTAGADLLQLASDDADLVPLAHAAGRLLAPDKPYLASQLAFAQALRGADTGNVLATLAANAFAATGTGVSALGAIADGIGDVDRVNPGRDEHAAWTGADYAAILHGVAGFLHEEQRGFPRFVAIVRGRNP